VPSALAPRDEVPAGDDDALELPIWVPGERLEALERQVDEIWSAVATDFEELARA
jgi:hypothetical protein